MKTIKNEKHEDCKLNQIHYWNLNTNYSLN